VVAATAGQRLVAVYISRTIRPPRAPRRCRKIWMWRRRRSIGGKSRFQRGVAGRRRISLRNGEANISASSTGKARSSAPKGPFGHPSASAIMPLLKHRASPPLPVFQYRSTNTTIGFDAFLELDLWRPRPRQIESAMRRSIRPPSSAACTRSREPRGKLAPRTQPTTHQLQRRPEQIRIAIDN